MKTTRGHSRAGTTEPRTGGGPGALGARALWTYIALIAVNLVIYLPIRSHDFVNWDDFEYVKSNPNVAGGLDWRGVTWAFTSAYAANWHPLTWLSHMVDVQFYGLAPGPHHVSSMLIHMANTLLLFAVLRRMTGAWGRSAFVAGLFAAHPLHVESVAWIAERKDVLSTLFWMLTLWAYAAYVRQPRHGRFLVVIVAYALGLMAKPMLTTLPFVLLLLDFWPLRRVRTESGKRRAWLWLVREKLPLFALALASSVVTIMVQRRGGAVSGLESVPLGQRVANALVSYAAYLVKMLWPVRLSVVYPYLRSLPGSWVIGAFLGLAAVTAAVFRAARRHPYLPVGWLWYVGTLVPVIGLIQVGSQPMADRYTYVPLIGVFVMASWGIPDLLAWFRLGASASRRAQALAAITVILACSVVARAQVRHWANSVSLWTHALGVTNGNSRAHNNLGTALANQGRRDQAIAHYREALRISPGFADASCNLGNALSAEGKLDDAAESYRAAIRADPKHANAHNGLGSVLDDQGKVVEAIAQYEEALMLNPDFAPAHNNMAAALAKLGRFDRAIHEELEAIRLESGEPDYHYNAAVLLHHQGRAAEARRELEITLRLDPGHEGARRALGGSD